MEQERGPDSNLDEGRSWVGAELLSWRRAYGFGGEQRVDYFNNGSQSTSRTIVLKIGEGGLSFLLRCQKTPGNNRPGGAPSSDPPWA
jgi:hypothetical protein